MRKMGYVDTESKDGTFSARILDVELAKRIRNHCKMVNQTPSRFVEDCVRKCLDSAAEEYLQSLSKEDLIKMIIEKE